MYETKAYIVLKPGYEKTEDLKQQIIEQLKQPIQKTNGEKEQLKTFEIPKTIEFIDELPYTKADKIDYQKLEEQASEEYKKEKQYKIGGKK